MCIACARRGCAWKKGFMQKIAEMCATASEREHLCAHCTHPKCTSRRRSRCALSSSSSRASSLSRLLLSERFKASRRVRGVSPRHARAGRRDLFHQIWSARNLRGLAEGKEVKETAFAKANELECKNLNDKRGIAIALEVLVTNVIVFSFS